MTSATFAKLDKSTARDELRKFFQLADDLGPGLTMFSPFIDCEWHELLEDRASYERFCMDSGTRVWEHTPVSGMSMIEWVPQYHERWGDLPAAWFAEKDGKVDQDAYQDYRDSKVVVASWDCTPSTGSVASVASEATAARVDMA